MENVRPGGLVRGEWPESILRVSPCITAALFVVYGQVEFWVVPDRDRDGRDSYRALDITILPAGTLELEEELHTSLRGEDPHERCYSGPGVN